MTNLSSRNFRHLVTIGDVGGTLMADLLEGGSSVRQPWEVVFVARLDGLHRILGGGGVEPFCGKCFPVEMLTEERAVPRTVAMNGGRADVDTADGSLGKKS